MNKIKQLILTLGIVSGLGVIFVPSTVGAVNVFSACTSTSESSVCEAQGDSVGTYVHIITNTLLFILGAVSVVVIIVGGFQYATSSGDSSKVTSAKNTIMYAVIGLVVAILAYAIVNFVVSAISPKAATTSATTTK
jgi:hypothetical protein